jgi:hypothetical protein
MAGLRKVSEGHYIASGSLADIAGPGRRRVTWLELRSLRPGEDLSTLTRFPDVDTLELDYVDDVDLSVLADLALRRLTLAHVSGVDLAAAAQLPALEILGILNVNDVVIPPLPLAPSLVGLTIINDDPDLDGRPVKETIEAIEWGRLGVLQTLTIRVGGLHQLAPIEVDLGFLACLPTLEYLVLAPGIHHAGRQPSPLEPPFDGLSRRLSYVRTEAADPDALEPALRAYLGPDAGLALKARRTTPAVTRPWSIGELPDGQGWVMYGSFFREEHGEHDDTEDDALRRARRRLRAADPALLRRLDFDPESAGTGISAASREDLERALMILGLTS